MTLVNKSGTIDYTQRAFHQDASSAMRGNIVRGLIELITNSDDAYASLKNGPKQKKIIIEVEHRRSQPCKVAVKDRATGMSPRTMIERITKLGGRTSGFESGENRRGNLGRGAKDLAAFGPVRFNSIHDGIFCELILQSDGSYKIESKKVTKKGRQQLGIPRGNGTVVTIHVKSTIRIPLHDNLQKQLSTHYQLRDILSDPSRRVELIKSNDGTKHLLTYKYPNLPVVFESDLDIEDYPNANAHLIIHRNPTCYEDGPHDTGRPNGIIIKGNRAIYDNTLFSFEHKQYSGWFSGELISPTIDQLAREYDDCLENNTEIPKNNPIPIIS